MSQQYNPEGWYYVIEPEGNRTGELRAGVYFEGENEIGRMEGGIFTYDMQPHGGKGHIEGLTLVRTDPQPETRFTLMPQENQSR
ncbi:hypothetical protein [Pseudomonas sp. MPC6]|uniref:hypothetical protein n=1 Tax=unclassified Pseudomonas TaxID=196821 RepID=UPI001110F6DC|nr:hypothetical protein [Pseudomonas sp. MPC6]QCY09576.1 hypothetical protein ELQ88_01770 [Pseudomonas sp. MPC6]